MSEDFELVKAEYNSTVEIEEIYSNPAVSFLMESIKLIPAVGNLVNNSIKAVIEMHQKKKLNQLLTLIFNDNSITIEDVKDVKVIMEFAKMIDIVNRLTRNEKIKDFASLFKSFMSKADKDYDEFEEFLQKLNDLSYREKEMLIKLYKEQKKLLSTDNSGKVVFDKEISWDNFLKAEEGSYSATDIVSIMAGSMRSGFCICEWSMQWNGESKISFYTTPSFEKFMNEINY